VELVLAQFTSIQTREPAHAVDEYAVDES